MRRPIGRDREIERASRALAGPGRVLLLGPPGVGKSTIASWIARERGAIWVDLEPLGRGDAVAGAVAAAVARALDVPVDAPALVGALQDVPLLVLDGVEEVGDAVVSWLGSITESTPDLTVLVSSRVRLPGFETLEIAPLDVASAMALFHASAESIGAGVSLAGEDEAVRELVARLDGLPLAVTLAASKLRLYAPSELLNEPPLEVLADRSRRGRHTSLQAALEVSWALLDEAGRSALARVSLARRWFGRTGFQEIAGLEPVVLEQLVDASLVRFTDTENGRRYHLLEPIRAFALARLPADDEARQRYLAGVLARAEAAADQVNTTASRDGLRRLRDLSADLEGVVAAGGDAAVRACLALATLAGVEGGTLDVLELLQGIDGSTLSERAGETARMLGAELLLRLRRADEALAAFETCPNDPELDVLRGVCAMRLGEPDEALRHLERALLRARAGEQSRLRSRPDDRVCAILLDIAAVHMERGAFDVAVGVCEQGLEVCASIDRPDIEGLLLRCLATATRLVSPNALEVSVERYERALELFRQIHNQRAEARVLSSLAVTEADLGVERVTARIESALPLARRLGERFMEHRMLVLAGLVAMDREELEEADRIFESLRPRAAKNRASLDCYRGILRLLRGDAVAGERLLEQGIATFDARGMEADRDLAAHYLAVARADPPPDARLERSHALKIAHQIVASRAEGRVLEPEVEEAARNDIDLRLMIRLTRLSGDTEVSRDGSWFRTGDGRVDLGRKRVLRRVLKVFAEHAGVALTTEQLLAGAWPGERTAGNSGRARVHVAVSELRKLGLRDALETATVADGTGYLLRARVLS